MTDSELVASCLHGRLESYRELMGRYSRYAMTVAWNILLNREDAEDACQEAFLKVYQNLGRFDAKQSFKNWLCALLANLCLDHNRKKRRSQQLVAVYAREIPKAGLNRAEPASSPAGLELGRLGPLSPKERLAIYLWAQEGYSGSEIAAVLGCSRNTAHTHLFRARQKLKSALKET